MGDLAGRVALVTGAGRGFGLAIAQRFAAEGARVAMLARSRGQIESEAQAIRNSGAEALAVRCDLRDPSAIAHAVQQTRVALGEIDIVVSNAGIPGPFGPMWEVMPERWWRAQELHIRAPFLLMHHLLPGMVERGRGHFLCVSAKASRIVAPGMSAYCTGKIAQNRLVAEAGAELAGTGVAVFAIDPGFAFTRLTRDMMEDSAAQAHLAEMVERLQARADDPASEADLEHCSRRCLDLVSGRYDALSGGYFEPEDDLDAAVRREGAQGLAQPSSKAAS